MKRVTPYLLLMLIVIIAFYQVAFLTQTLKYDILDGYLPGHFFISECLRNNVFPLWNPYLQLGFPIYADLTNTNYPIDMFIARVFPYTNVTFHFLFIAYIILGGWGTYRLSKQLGISNRNSILIAISYSLSGFFIGNAQHIQFIISGAWLPFAFLYFIKIAQHKKIKDVFLFVSFMFLQISGGYPSIAIVLCYILAALFIYYLVRFIKRNAYRETLKFLILCLAAGIILAVLCSGILISIFQSSPYVGRYISLDYEYSTTNAFPPESLISLITPLTTVINPEIFRTDISMSNHYFGVIMLILFIYAVFTKYDKKSSWMLIAGVITLFLSFGDHFFLHKYLYDYLPLFDKFRHASSFRIFTILFFLLFSGLKLTQHDPTQKENWRVFTRAYLSIIGLLVVTLLISFIYIVIKIAGPFDFNPAWNNFLNDFGAFGPVAVQLSIILILNSLFVYFIIFKKKLNSFYPLIIVLLSIEMIAFTQLNLNYTVTTKWNPKEIRAFLDNRPKGFPLPGNELLSDNTDESVSNFPIVRNTNVYAKTVSPYGRYPFYLDGFSKLKSDTQLFRNTIQNRLLYFGDTLITGRFPEQPANKRYVLLDDTVFQKLHDVINFKTTCYDSIVCTRFSPSEMIFRTNSVNRHFAVLQQNNYAGWSVLIDGRKSEHYTVNHSLIGIDLPAGTHEVIFRYENPLYIRATLFGFAIFGLLIIAIIAIKTYENRNARLKYIYITSGILILVYTWAAVKPKVPFEFINKHNQEEIVKLLNSLADLDRSDAFVVFNTGSQVSVDSIHLASSQDISSRTPVDGKRLLDILDTLQAARLIYVWSNVLEQPETEDIIQIHFPKKGHNDIGYRYAVKEFLKDTTKTEHQGITDTLAVQREFSFTFHDTLDQVPDTWLKVFSSVKFLNTGNQTVHLVISINRRGKTKYYHAVDLNQYRTKADGWNTGFASVSWLKSSLKKGDEIVVYCWNSGKNDAVYLDDFYVQLQPH